MAITYDINTDIGKMRLFLQDTDTENAVFQDEELAALLQQVNEDLYMAASTGWAIIAGDKAKIAKKKTASKFSYDNTQMAKECRAQAEHFKKLSEEQPVFDFASWGVTDFAERDILIDRALEE